MATQHRLRLVFGGPSHPKCPRAKAKKYYEYTAIDDCTRLRVLRIYPRNDQATAIQFRDHATIVITKTGGGTIGS